MCSINGKSYLTHRLIAIAFIPNPNNYEYINHIDGNKLNNSVDNLEWCTMQHNIKHAYDTGLKTGYWKNKKGKEHSMSKSVFFINSEDVKITFESISEAASIMGLTRQYISTSCKNDKPYKGIIWRYSIN